MGMSDICRVIVGIEIHHSGIERNILVSIYSMLELKGHQMHFINLQFSISKVSTQLSTLFGFGVESVDDSIYECHSSSVKER